MFDIYVVPDDAHLYEVCHVTPNTDEVSDIAAKNVHRDVAFDDKFHAYCGLCIGIKDLFDGSTLEYVKEFTDNLMDLADEFYVMNVKQYPKMASELYREYVILSLIHGIPDVRISVARANIFIVDRRDFRNVELVKCMVTYRNLKKENKDIAFAGAYEIDKDWYTGGILGTALEAMNRAHKLTTFKSMVANKQMVYV